MPTYKTPDVYVEEISVFPPSVAEVETAIPAFIGYTEKAINKTADDLILVPTRIESLKDYELYFGGPKDDAIALTVEDQGDAGYKVTSFTEPTVLYILYYSVKLFFDNGGGQCYITSVGTYQEPAAIELDTAPLDTFGLRDGLDAVALEDEPTLVVIPETVNLTAADYSSLVEAVLAQCGTLKDRFGIFDLRDGGKDLTSADLDTNRGYFGTSDSLKYGAAHYPFLKTTLNYSVKDDESNVSVIFVPVGGPANAVATLDSFKNSNTAIYNFVKSELKEHFIILPPSGPVTGVYAATDTSRGVWKAPANVSLADVIEPMVKLDTTTQDALNVDATSGKSINALRSFAAKGTLVWGARTLDGNSNEWRYISVRRFFNMVEESVKKSTYWAVFETNDANTWVKVRGMIENYLTQKWRDGALAGATTKNAFFRALWVGHDHDQPGYPRRKNERGNRDGGRPSG